MVNQFEPNFENGLDAPAHSFVVNNINIPGDVNMTLRLFGSNGNQQITLDDIIWTGLSGSANPSLSITSPSEGAVLPPNADVLVNFTALNFDIATDGNANNHVKYTLYDGTANMAYTQITLTWVLLKPDHIRL